MNGVLIAFCSLYAFDVLLTVLCIGIRPKPLTHVGALVTVLWIAGLAVWLHAAAPVNAHTIPIYVVYGLGALAQPFLIGRCKGTYTACRWLVGVFIAAAVVALAVTA